MQTCMSKNVVNCNSVTVELPISNRLGLTQEWFRELSFSRVECGVHNRLYIYPPPPCGIFYFPWYRHHMEGTRRLLVSHPKDTGNVG